jgi:hypothetical protein
MFNAVGITLYFLPRYSPELNPIELKNGWIKMQVAKRWRAIQASGNTVGRIMLLMNAIPPATCAKWVEHCQYVL